MNINIICIICIIIFIVLYFKSLQYPTINEISRIDNNIYIVRDELNKQQAANILAIIKHKSILLIEKLFIEYPNDNKILLLIKKFNPNNIWSLAKVLTCQM